MIVSIIKATSDQDIQTCLNIRFQIFVQGQQVPIDEEIDGKDKESTHFLLCLDDHPAGTARVRVMENVAKIERVAILDEFQGKGLGQELMLFILTEVQQHTSVKKIKLSAQTYVIPFYEKLGFKVCSDEYMDAGIPHQDMELHVSK